MQPKTLVCHPRNGMLFYSDYLWKDPTYAIKHAPHSDFRPMLETEKPTMIKIFGSLPQYPGEFIDTRKDKRKHDPEF